LAFRLDFLFLENFVDRCPGQRLSATQTVEAYFAQLGFRVALGASDDLDATGPAWQVGPLRGDHIHVLEFSTRSALWKWWRGRVTVSDVLEAGPDPFFAPAQIGPGWTRRALLLNADAVRAPA
jgi:hypothetical protein